MIGDFVYLVSEVGIRVFFLCWVLGIFVKFFFIFEGELKEIVFFFREYLYKFMLGLYNFLFESNACGLNIESYWRIIVGFLSVLIVLYCRERKVFVFDVYSRMI